MQKYGKFVETRFHELEHESKMRLSKPTPTPLNGEATKAARNAKKIKRKEAYPYGTGKTSSTATDISPGRGGRGENVSTPKNSGNAFCARIARSYYPDQPRH